MKRKIFFNTTIKQNEFIQWLISATPTTDVKTELLQFFNEDGKDKEVDEKTLLQLYSLFQAFLALGETMIKEGRREHVMSEIKEENLTTLTEIGAWILEQLKKFVLADEERMILKFHSSSIFAVVMEEGS